MRIVQLANFYSTTSGGLRTAVDAVGRGYVACGHQRILVVPGDAFRRRHTDGGLVITVPGVPVSGGYRMIARPAVLLRVLDEVAADAVEVSDKLTMVPAAGWARTRGAGAVLFSHERLDRWLAARWPGLARRAGGAVNKAVRAWNRRIAGMFDTVVVTSAYAEAEFAQLGVRNLRRVPLGVDLTTFRPRPVAPDRPVARLLYAGRLSPEKNVSAVITAMRRLSDRGIAAHLDVYGDGAARDVLVAQAAGLPVTFHGHLAERGALARAMAGADLVFAPSWAETFGLSILEAMACGTPVVVAAPGGAPELMAPYAGLAVPADADGLAAGAAEVLSWPAAGRRAAARRRAEQFPWSATVSAMLDLHGDPHR